MPSFADALPLIVPQWPAPSTVHAYSTTRVGGVSAAPYNGCNLATHVGDAPHAVQENRARLRQRLDLPGEPCWLQQVHGDRVLEVDSEYRAVAEADAAWSAHVDVVCVVMTADCLPVLLCDEAGSRVAAAHAGWRGLECGIVERTVAAMGVAPQGVMAWLGPAIGPTAFEVGDEVRAAFLRHDTQAAEAFVASGPGRWLADIYRLARQRLRRAGVDHVYGGGDCTVTNPQRYFSYRRDGVTGRMASLIWRTGAQL